MLRAIREIQPRWVVGENVRGLTNWNGGVVFDEVQADLETEGYEITPFLLPACAVNAPHRRDRIWFVAHSTRFSNGTNKLRSLRCENGEIEGEGSQTIHNAFRSDGIERVTANPNSNGLNQCNSDNEINTNKGRINALGNINASIKHGYDTNSKNQGLEGMRREERGYSELHRGQSWIQDWKNFPTVSPICDGDDGIPNRLDSITFPKWRNESIKAGGNAIVPQVVYQIFKSIEQYERINTPDKNN
jgi:DNA (cytosine-5)-methyltransferase 1